MTTRADEVAREVIDTIRSLPADAAQAVVEATVVRVVGMTLVLGVAIGFPLGVIVGIAIR
ncbi:MAG TPA: hypothetical protein VGS18_01485 [Thermoplasmata archaeon]|nr:hypothetical protein [Thermoplasmata archaeon]